MGPRPLLLTPARACALRVVRRVFEQDAYADRALAAEAAGLEPRDRALATQIAYGTVQRRATLDHVAQRLVSRPLASLEPVVLAALRIGLYQLIYLDGVPAHAAVAESVELAKADSRGGAGLVNAVLRRAAGEASELLEGTHDRTPAGAAVLHSVPEWLAELWFEELGPTQARALLARINQPAESSLRVNTLLASVGEVVGELPVAHHPAAGIPEGVVLDGPFDLEGSDMWRGGRVMAQSRASMLVGRALAPVAGERVLDLCAAPGGKTTHLAALLANTGSVVAVERHPGRAAALERTVARMGARCVSVRIADARHGLDERFDRVLVDPPCSGLGTLQSRPDRRWRVQPSSIGELADLQADILTAGARTLRPGGRLLYSVCTISRREGIGVLERVLRRGSELEVEDLGAEYPQWRSAEDARCLQLLPHRDLTDGFFLARLRRGGG